MSLPLAPGVSDVRQNITGIILIGGKSRRMGRDKAFLEFAGKPLFERVLETFRECFDRIMLVGDREERFAHYGVPFMRDIFHGGALGGLYTGLHFSATEYIFVSPCDLPFPNKDMIRYLCSLRHGFDAVVPDTAHGFEPLFALYSRTCLGPIRRQFEKGNLCVYDFYPAILTRYISDEELRHLDPGGRCFLNINTPEEFARIEEELPK